MKTPIRRRLTAVLAGLTVLAAGACSKGGQAGGPEVTAFINKLKAANADLTSVHLTMDVTGAGQDISMAGDATYEVGNPAMQLQMNLGSIDIDMIYVDKELYLKGFPNDPSGEWTKADANSSTAKQLIASTSQMDPNATYSSFEEAATEVKETGSKTIDGEQMNTYEVSLDPTKAKEIQSQAGADQLPDEIVYTIALDQQDRMRRVGFELMGVKAEIKMDKYNEPLEIKAPTGDLPTSKIP